MRLIDCSTPKFPNTFAMVDEEDYDRLTGAWKWSATASLKDGTIYARRSRKMDGKTSTTPMHRDVLGSGVGVIIDHIDGNGLNNQKANLRVCTKSENLFNSRKRRGPTSSRYKGVSFIKKDNLWRAQIQKDKIRVTCGCFRSEVEAAKAYNAEAVRLHGPFARINNIEGVGDYSVSSKNTNTAEPIDFVGQAVFAYSRKNKTIQPTHILLHPSIILELESSTRANHFVRELENGRKRYQSLEVIAVDGASYPENYVRVLA